MTVEKKEGLLDHNGHSLTIVDLPGTYSLTAYSMEEVIARDYIVSERPDVVVNIVDASNLERNLYLTVQLLEMGAPVILALNMIDAAESAGLRIDHAQLGTLLGVPVVPMVARTGKGRVALLDEILKRPPAASIRETNSWTWPAFSLGYHTVLAWVVCFAVYQGGRLVGL